MDIFVSIVRFVQPIPLQASVRCARGGDDRNSESKRAWGVTPMPSRCETNDLARLCVGGGNGGDGNDVFHIITRL
jgi:hypothetical protein